MLETFVLLLAAHVAADFLLQDEAMAAGKTDPMVLLRHVGIVVATAAIALGLPALPPLALLALTHYAIDHWKAHHGGPGIRAFLADQAGHVAVLAAIAAIWPGLADQSLWLTRLAGGDGPAAEIPEGAGYAAVAMATGAVAAVWAGAIGMRIFAEMLPTPAAGPDGGLRNGGLLIGILERAIVYGLVLVGAYGAVGFLVAAKSLLRFEEAKQRATAEYVIIGTFASVGWAMLVGLLTRAAVDALV